MNVDKQQMLLYAVTDRTWLGQQSLAEQVGRVIRSGVTFVQLREKHLPLEQFIALGMQVKQVTDQYGIPLVINDNIEVAIAVDADGVHVGQEDLSALEVRQQIGDEKILGVSVQNVAQALLAQQQGADYLGVGAVFTTTSKDDAQSVSLEMLKAICQAVSIPVVAIGGINSQNVLDLVGTGVDGIAVISAIFASAELEKATEQLAQLATDMVATPLMK